MAPINLDKIRTFLLSKMGLHYDKKHETALYAKLSKAASNFNFRDTDKFIDWLLQQPMNASQIKLLASSLTIGETYFFREESALDYFRLVFLPELIKQKSDKQKKLRIWSAGCSTGEEPYTLAIILQQALPEYQNWDITILASDINPTFLTKARKGIYSNWSFRKTSESFKQKYFKKLDENNYQIIDSVKEMVTFTHLNLASNDYPSIVNNTNNFDAIFCRNVLIYFEDKGIENVSNNFYKALNMNGMLAVSPVETPKLLSSSFCRTTVKGNTFFRKQLKTTTNPATLKRNDFQVKDFTFQTRVVTPSKKTNIPKIVEPNLSIKQKSSVTKTIVSKTAQLDSNESETLTRAKHQYKIGKLKEAEQLLKTIKPKDKDSESKVLLLLARIYADTSQLQKSEKCCIAALGIDKINSEAHYLLATVYSEQRRYQETIQSLNKLLFLEPDYVVAHFLLGNTYFKMGNIKYGTKHLSNASKCLSKLNSNEIINECDGLTAYQLSALIDTITPQRKNAKVF